MNRTGSGAPHRILLPHVKPECYVRPLKPISVVPAIFSTISLLSSFSHLGTVTPWLSGDKCRRPPPRRLTLQMKRWIMVKVAADDILAVAAIFGAFVAKRGTSGEACLSYQQGIVYTALRLVLSPHASDSFTIRILTDTSVQILRCVADVCFGQGDTEHVAYTDLGLLTFRFRALDAPAMYCFLRAVKHAGAK
ncbi:hypothetical protein EDC04DRAFT_1199580 [Pisolithus marmoratus]|nr:hypothetical protein EDC04DRAFT_1199580 [Pisolithus marmoratus]